MKTKVNRVIREECCYEPTL